MTEELWAYVVDAACGLAQMSTAALIDLHQPPGARVAAAEGAIADGLRAIPAHDWVTISGLSSLGTSCHTSGSESGIPFFGYPALRATGANAVIIVPVFADGKCRALLLCADGSGAAPGAIPVERLEMLAAQTGSRLQTLRAMDELRARTMQDSLTGLGNRTWFVAEVGQRLEAWSRQEAGQFVVMFCDLNGFKDVDDSLGHAAGDRLLIMVADRMRQQLHSNELLARLGGDEFGFCSDGFESVVDAVIRAGDIPSLLAPHFDLGGVEVAITASIGIAVVSTDDTSPPDAPTLLGEADAAMYEAKRHGRSGVARFSEADDQLVLLYQPAIALPHGDVIGMEALLRWRHPQRGLLDDGETCAIVAAIVVMARALGLDIVAEGVETVGQRDRLTDLGCPNAQGYLFEKPQTSEAITEILSRQSLARAAVSSFGEAVRG